MELSMSERPKALLIVEGGRTEFKFFEHLAKVFNTLPFDIVPYGNNIHALYKRLKKDHFEVNIKDILLEHANTEEERLILNQDFTYTYLIYDCDPHHTSKDDSRNIHTICKENMANLNEMLQHFTDETDSTIGKLFINYPMMESFRDANDFFDAEYAHTVLTIETKESFTGYKNATSRKRLAQHRIDKWNESNFYNLIKMNLFKLNQICFEHWELPSYESYRNIMDQHIAFQKEQDACISLKILYVLNTSILLLLDYFGQPFHSKLATLN